MENQHWQTKTTFLCGVKGNVIVEELDKIHCSENMFVTDKIILPAPEGGTFFCWITYKVNPQSLKQINKTTMRLE